MELGARVTVNVRNFNTRRRKRASRGRIASSDVWCYSCATYVPLVVYHLHEPTCLKLRREIDARKRARA